MLVRSGVLSRLCVTWCMDEEGRDDGGFGVVGTVVAELVEQRYWFFRIAGDESD